MRESILYILPSSKLGCQRVVGAFSEEAKRLKQSKNENKRLKRLVADQALDIQVLKLVNEGNW